MEICRLFDQNFREHLDETTINGEFRKLITEADGYQPHLIAPEQVYQRLIESILVTIRGPAEAAVDATHSILKDLVHKAISETPGIFKEKTDHLYNAATQERETTLNQLLIELDGFDTGKVLYFRLLQIVEIC
ncbi:hypothetical protein GOBAR_AA37366 [Gossypium barbadense]|uniref:Dynamin stalk domain-containing protein n=1 Tax=Gossypium barbadense TaxID=3634 RepID=A0A2P5VWY8_GOSBA|nr:hypothetical protein GOBAR_AA37366 [Gossypium barbadense]